MLRIWLERGGRVKLDKEITTEEIYKKDYKCKDINIEIGDELTVEEITSELESKGLKSEGEGFRINDYYFLTLEIECTKEGKLKIVNYEIE